VQPGALFRKVFSEEMRKNTIANLGGAMKGVRGDIA
jgi:catalase